MNAAVTSETAMGRKKSEKIILPPKFPPEIPGDEVEVFDEDLQFVQHNRHYALGFSRLNTQSLTKSVHTQSITKSVLSLFGKEQLLQMQKQYKLIKPGSPVLDLSCAPGAWLQIQIE
nr:ribosomal rna large subunit methyltransferase e [Quercus suber]